MSYEIATIGRLLAALSGCSSGDHEHPQRADSGGYLTDTGPFDRDGDGYTAASDCDDSNENVHPGAVEHCDAADEDCDEAADDDAVDAVEWHVDADGDGSGSSDVGAIACTAPSGLVGSADDCDDTDATVHPGAPEICDDQRDNDCVPGGDDACRVTGSHSTGDYFIPLVSSGSFPGVSSFYENNELATGADVNGDGRTEIFVGLSDYPETGDKQLGAAVVIDGSLEADTVYGDRLAIITGDQPREYVAQAVVGLGDIDGDGFGDLAVGDPQADSGWADGKVGIFHGPIAGDLTISDADLILQHETRGTLFGDDLSPLVSTADDTQLVVAAQSDYFVGIERYGGIYVLDPVGDGTSLVGPDNNIALYTGEELSARAGSVVHDLGDTNGDGVSDLGLSCEMCLDYNGIVYVVLGPHEGERSLADADSRYLYGAYFGPTGDTDGDGLADLAIRQSLSVDLYLGPTASGTTDMSKVLGSAHLERTVVPFFTVDLLGTDVDGDDFSDLVIPDPYGGNVYLFYGPVSGSGEVATSADLFLSGSDSDYPSLGWDIESLGDLDDDGHDDLIVSDWDMNLYVMLGEGI
jgi:hypothetical protein